MSNFLAIATVTATLRNLLHDTAVNDVTDHEVKVATGRPDSTVGNAPETKINIYLYQVTPNAALRNADLPTRRADGTLLQRPQVALDLHYMISFYGDETDLVSQRLLGSVVRTLHARPVLTRDQIRQTISNGAALLADSNLADQVELVKFSPLHLSLEELSKIWSVFFQIPYVLSVAYQGTVVLIEGDDMPQGALPVRSCGVSMTPPHQPVIERITTEEATNRPQRPNQFDPPITVDNTLLIQGRRLQGEITVVRIGGVEVIPLFNDVSDTQIRLPLAAHVPFVDDVRAGAQGIQVIHRMPLGLDKVPDAHQFTESNVAAFVLRPTITTDNITPDLQGDGATLRTGKITVKQIKPVVGKTQRVALLLNEINPDRTQPLGHTPHLYRFDTLSEERTWQKNQAGEEISDTLIFSIKEVRPGAHFKGVSPGTYLVRIQVDGAESLLQVDADPKSPTFNTYVGEPKVIIS